MDVIEWHNAQTLKSRSFDCGYCGEAIASEKGYIGVIRGHVQKTVYIYVCHFCFRPSYFDTYNEQTPGSFFGNSVSNIPDANVEKLYNEARTCYSNGLYTSCVMCCRKLLMNIAVTEGEDHGKTYLEYVNYLDSKNYIPPKGKGWVDTIRKLGNEANHSIEFRSPEDARLILTFTEMLLKFIYEMPGLLGGKT